MQLALSKQISRRQGKHWGPQGVTLCPHWRNNRLVSLFGRRAWQDKLFDCWNVCVAGEYSPWSQSVSGAMFIVFVKLLWYYKYVLHRDQFIFTRFCTFEKQSKAIISSICCVCYQCRTANNVSSAPDRFTRSCLCIRGERKKGEEGKKNNNKKQPKVTTYIVPFVLFLF